MVTIGVYVVVALGAMLLMAFILNPRDSSKRPIEAEATPFPKLEMTPPVIKMYLGMRGFLQTLRYSRQILRCIHPHRIIGGV